MDTDPFRFTIEGTVAAVGSVLAAAFSILSWARQARGDKLHVSLDRSKIKEGASSVRAFLVNGGSRPALIGKIVVEGGTFATPGEYDPSTGRVAPHTKSDIRERTQDHLVQPGETAKIDLLLFSDSAGKISASVSTGRRSAPAQLIVSISRE